MKLLIFVITLIAAAAAHSQWFDYVSPNQLVKCGTYGIVTCKGVGSSMTLKGHTYVRDFSNSSYQWKAIIISEDYLNTSVSCIMRNLYQIMYQKTVQVNCVYKEPRRFYLTSNQTVQDGTKITFHCHGNGQYTKWYVRNVYYPSNHPSIKDYSTFYYQNTTLRIYGTKATDGWWVRCIIYQYLIGKGPLTVDSRIYNKISKTSYIFIEEGSGQSPIYPSDHAPPKTLPTHHPSTQLPLNQPTTKAPPPSKNPTIPTPPNNDDHNEGGYFALLWSILAGSKDLKITH